MTRDKTVRAALAASVALALGCTEAPAASDAGRDAPVADAPPPDGGIVATGNLALIDVDLSVSLAEDFHVCVVGATTPCGDTGILGNYTVAVPANAELALRMTHLTDTTLVPFIKPLHSGTTDVNAHTLAMPRRAVFDAVLAASGGFPGGVGYALVYVERPVPGDPLNLVDRGVSGYAVTSDLGTVRYVNPTFDGIDAAATATTAAGLVLITDIPAGAWTDGGGLGDTVTVTITAPTGEPLCGPLATTSFWLRSEGAGTFTVEAPVFSDHVTYAAFLTCSPLP